MAKKYCRFFYTSQLFQYCKAQHETLSQENLTCILWILAIKHCRLENEAKVFEKTQMSCNIFLINEYCYVSLCAKLVELMENVHGQSSGLTGNTLNHGREQTGSAIALAN